MISEESEYKPSFRHYTVKYTDENEKLRYQMPYLYIRLFISLNDISEEEKKELPSKLLESQGNFTNRVILAYGSDVLYPNVTAFPFHEKDKGTIGEDISFIVGFRIGVSEFSRRDKPTFVCLFDHDAISLNGTVRVEQINFMFDRQDDTLPKELPIFLDYNRDVDDEEFEVYFIGYQETVTHKYRSNDRDSQFDITWSQTTATTKQVLAIMNVTVRNNFFMFDIKPDMEVDHWTEYVAFSYGDWLTGMGGLFSILVTAFFWISYGTAVYLGDGISMGILPGLSYNFFSYEEILWIKNRLDKAGIF